MSSVPPDALRALARRSVEVIAGHQDVGVAYPASPTFPVYRYSWFRDGAFIADAMSRAGEIASAERFFRWCARVVVSRGEHVRSLVARARRGDVVDPGEHLPTRYAFDGGDTGEEWWDFQLDGYGTWMWALAAHIDRHADARRISGGQIGVDDTVRDAVVLCADYLCAFWDHPCFDWWEEHPDGVHPSTLGAIHAGLGAAARIADLPRDVGERCDELRRQIAAAVATRGTVDGHLVKTFDAGPRVDASLIACCTPFALVDPFGPVAEATYTAIRDDLAPDGVHRYLGDTFYGGGRWVVLAGFLGWHEAATGRVDEARRRIEWMWRQRTDDALLPEQVTDHSLDAEHIATWEAKWGPVATPLLWSHAMYLTLADSLGLLEGLHDD